MSGPIGRLAQRSAAAARRQLWRAALTSTGGLQVEGQLSTGGCVVVANHGSHADAAAVLAALPASSRPVVVCAADYWRNGSRRRRLLSRTLVSTHAVRRDGGGGADLALAAAALRDGRAVVVFPEGTRSRDGLVAAFRTGAFRLADEAGVPVVPVGITGTRELLPPNGPLRRTPVGVRSGGPSLAADAEAARSEVVRLAAPTAARPDSAWRQRVARLAMAPAGMAVVAGWSVAEAFSWPLVPEVVVGVLVLAAPRSVLRLVAAAVVASAVGGLLALSLARAGWVFPQPLVTAPMRTEVQREVSVEGARAVAHQPMSGIPLKVYAAEAGRTNVSPVAFTTASISGRGRRIVVVGALLALAGAALSRWRHYYPIVVATALTIFAIGLANVVAGWS
jgi:1-acyl-sn-glycerol-3-phosphate acyltransferase